ncbi:hypothetical protein [Roseibaca sp. Y0-43]|uniref:hypothetical protein n=1 Tax=Roseibaca sp. Y0-43 TaxID=2816854 RepID=UPI001D0CA45A|nr:hypothetical protein [Roseibaca sp. Y0-43]MCC1480672.1 hypothetical protein [Roseibaca sp. Y0-43]
MKRARKNAIVLPLARFLLSERGAITTESIIVGAAILGTAIATMSQVHNGVEPLGVEVQTTLSNAQVATLGTLGTAPE